MWYINQERNMAKKSAKIIEIKEIIEESGLIIIEQVGIDPLIELQEELEGIEDTRFEPHVEHLLSDIVMITLLVVMARANEWNKMAAYRHA
jgi:hypothetical protein